MNDREAETNAADAKVGSAPAVVASKAAPPKMQRPGEMVVEEMGAASPPARPAGESVPPEPPKQRTANGITLSPIPTKYAATLVTVSKDIDDRRMRLALLVETYEREKGRLVAELDLLHGQFEDGMKVAHVAANVPEEGTTCVLLDKNLFATGPRGLPVETIAGYARSILAEEEGNR